MTAQETITIRIRRSRDPTHYQKVTLLYVTHGWTQVNDGQGPLWVMFSQVHREDMEKVLKFRPVVN